MTDPKIKSHLTFIPTNELHLFTTFPDNTTEIRKLFLPRNLHDIAISLIPNKKNEEYTEIERSLFKSDVETALKKPFNTIERYLEKITSEEISSFDHSTSSDGTNGKHLITRTYLLSNTPSYIDTIITLYQLVHGVKDSIYSKLRRQNRPNEMLLNPTALFDTLFKRQMPLDLIHIAIKLIKILDKKQMPYTCIITVSLPRLIKQTGISENKVNRVFDWFVTNEMVKTHNQNLQLRHSFFVHFYGRGNLKIPNSPSSQRKNREEFPRIQAWLFEITKEYPVIKHDENELNMKKVRNLVCNSLQQKIEKLKATEEQDTSAEQLRLRLQRTKIIALSFIVR